jgi:dimethylhistidine N-methyltransferase
MLDAVAPAQAVRFDPDVADAALAGLLLPQKTLPAKLFYDDEGCRLFGAITELPEYYVTRTERRLLQAIAPELGADAPEGAALVEYGASREDKAEVLIRCMRRPLAYVPIDIASGALAEMAERMVTAKVAVYPVAGDFLVPIKLPAAVSGMPVIGFFPGSTIGNLEPATAKRFLHQAKATLGPAALFLVGIDLRKDPSILIPAYDDSAGVTAAFNRNLLVRLNREAHADFAVDRFNHEARWNAAEGRIEMHLVSMADQTAHVAGHIIHFERGESIHTENSYKHTISNFALLARSAGWQHRWVRSDAYELFSLHLLDSGDTTS